MNVAINNVKSKLYYVHDPMCSWCWAFNSVWADVTGRLPESITLERVLGGLAPDTEQAMPEELQQKIQNTWRTIQEVVPGTAFNFDFWKDCNPRRATYAACRAVIAATKQATELEASMILSIQKAYYRDARNPSDNSVLIDLAASLDMDTKQFAEDLDSAATNEELARQIALSRKLGARGFPSLILETGESGYRRLDIDYLDPNKILDQMGG